MCVEHEGCSYWPVGEPGDENTSSWHRRKVEGTSAQQPPFQAVDVSFDSPLENMETVPVCFKTNHYCYFVFIPPPLPSETLLDYPVYGEGGRTISPLLLFYFISTHSKNIWDLRHNLSSSQHKTFSWRKSFPTTWENFFHISPWIISVFFAAQRKHVSEMHDVFKINNAYLPATCACWSICL